MREGWGRVSPVKTIRRDELNALIAPAFPDDEVATLEPAIGGLANTNLRLTLMRRREPLLLRLWTRAPEDAPKERALHALAAARHVPVPTWFYFESSNPLTGDPYAVIE